jgi:transcriptional regulator with XRE-family HTH domain
MTAHEVELKDYVLSLRETDVRDDAAFTDLLTRGFDLLHLMDKDIAREFGISRPSVTRWRNGVNAPHPAMRKPVYAFLNQRAQAMLRRIPKEEPTESRHIDSSPAYLAAIPVAARGRSE